MLHNTWFYRLSRCVRFIDYPKLASKYRHYLTANILSSHSSNEILLYNMESHGEKANLENSKDITYNSTYAQVLSKSKAEPNDASNNNPSTDDNKNVTLNIEQDSHNHLSESVMNADSNLTENSQSDSFEDAEDSQEIISSSTVKSSDYIQNTADETSSLVTADSGESKQTDQNNSGSHSEYSESGEEADLEEETAIVDELYPNAVKWRFRTEKEFNLPKTVTVLEASHGSKVFLVGSAHFSKESQEDVSQTIRAVQPDVVMIELCKSRVNLLSLDEATILEESKNMNFQKIKTTIEQNGFLQGALYLLFLNMSAHLTKQLGMAPGGEFRRAFLEAKQIPGCLVHLGDRPIHITLQRALATLSWWQKLRMAWYMLRAKDPISKEEVEKCKEKDLLEEMLAEMTGEFPELCHVFLKERDIYLTYSLQMSALHLPSPQGQDVSCPSYVVGVVGIGHVPGIVENWGKITEDDIPPILQIPQPSLSSKIIHRTIRISLLGLGIYGLYKIFPKSLIPEKTFQSFISLKPIQNISSYFVR